MIFCCVFIFCYCTNRMQEYKKVYLPDNIIEGEPIYLGESIDEVKKTRRIKFDDSIAKYVEETPGAGFDVLYYDFKDGILNSIYIENINKDDISLDSLVKNFITKFNDSYGVSNYFFKLKNKDGVNEEFKLWTFGRDGYACIAYTPWSDVTKNKKNVSNYLYVKLERNIPEVYKKFIKRDLE